MEMLGQTRETNARSKRFHAVTMLLCNGRKKGNNEHSRLKREGKFIAIRVLLFLDCRLKKEGKKWMKIICIGRMFAERSAERSNFNGCLCLLVSCVLSRILLPSSHRNIFFHLTTQRTSINLRDHNCRRVKKRGRKKRKRERERGRDQSLAVAKVRNLCGMRNGKTKLNSSWGRANLCRGSVTRAIMRILTSGCTDDSITSPGTLRITRHGKYPAGFIEFVLVPVARLRQD